MPLYPSDTSKARTELDGALSELRDAVGKLVATVQRTDSLPPGDSDSASPGKPTPDDGCAGPAIAERGHGSRGKAGTDKSSEPVNPPKLTDAPEISTGGVRRFIAHLFAPVLKFWRRSERKP